MTKRRSHLRSGTVRVDVDVDVDDILEELSDEDLREYCTERGIIAGRIARLGLGAPPDPRGEAEYWASEMWEAFVTQDRLHFRVLIERMLPPHPPITGAAEKEKAA